MHWHSFQLKILVHIYYKWSLVYIVDLSSIENKFIAKYYYIANDTEHDILFVQHYFELHWTHLMECGIYPNEHIVWYDGCATQFKPRQTWYHVTK